MPEVKTGDVLNCEVCGLTVIVNEECECADAEIFCCEEPMVNKGPALKKAASGKKTAAKKVSPAVKKTAKTAAKKAVAKKMKK
ncbi:MAG: hypothetical protein ABFD50_07585 [Smithella sp.]